MSKVLIMGGNGFIGSNIANYLHSKDVEVGIYDVITKDNGYINYQGNVLTDDKLDDIIKEYDSIIYLITSVSPKKSMDFPCESYVQDIPMLLRVLDSCVKSGRCNQVLFSSSGGTVYGEGLGKDLKEDEVVEEPINHYAICKVACEKILLLYNKLHGMNNIVLRIANPYGKGQNPVSGVGAITAFADKIKNGQKISLYGDGSIIRDFIDIDTVCDAFYKALQWNFDRNISPVFNVGSGIPLSLKDIIDIISSVLNIEPEIEYLENRPFDVKKNVLDMNKTISVLGLDMPSNHEEKIGEYIKELIKDNTNSQRKF